MTKEENTCQIDERGRKSTTRKKKKWIWGLLSVLLIFISVIKVVMQPDSFLLTYKKESNDTGSATVSTKSDTQCSVSSAKNVTYRERAVKRNLKGFCSDTAANDSWTYVSEGTISQDTVWDNGTYFVQGNIKVAQGVTLQVKPGTTIFCAKARRIDVFGRLLAQGTSKKPIIFTTIEDSVYGGNGVFDSEDCWQGIYIGRTGELNGDNVKIKYGGYFSTYNCNISALNVVGKLNLVDSEIRNSFQDGIRIDSEKDITIQNTIIDGSQRSGIRIGSAGGAVFQVENNIITNNAAYPISILLSGISSSEVISGIATNNTFSGNKYLNLIFLEGNFAVDNTLSKNKYIITGCITIPKNITVTLQPGVTIFGDKTYSDVSYIDVFGNLNVLGAKENPVIITSTTDPAYVGAGVMSYANNWGGIRIKSTGKLQAYYFNVSYGSTNIDVSGNITLVHSKITDAGAYGIYFHTEIQPTLLYNAFKNNPYAVYNAGSGKEIKAIYNYWNSVNGPSVYKKIDESKQNARISGGVGSGDKIYGSVEYTPYLEEEAFHNLKVK